MQSSRDSSTGRGSRNFERSLGLHVDAAETTTADRVKSRKPRSNVASAGSELRPNALAAGQALGRSTVHAVSRTVNAERTTS